MDKQQAATDPPKEPGKEKPSGGFTAKLRKPIQAHGEEVSVLHFREPTGRDIMTVGCPVKVQPIKNGIECVIEADAMSGMMSVLAAVPPSSIAQLNTRDWITIATRLQNFFAPDWEQLRVMD